MAPIRPKIFDIGELHAHGVGAGFGVSRQPLAHLLERFLGPGVAARDQNESDGSRRAFDGGFDLVDDESLRRNGKFFGEGRRTH